MLNKQRSAVDGAGDKFLRPAARVISMEQWKAQHPAEPFPYALIVHGTPITPRHLLKQLSGCSFCVSYAAPEQLEQCIQLLGPDSILLLDNGAFSHWRSGKGCIDRRRYWRWANEIMRRCPQAIAVIPDVIGGSEEQNFQELLHAFDIDEGLCEFPERAMFVWHMNESFLQLERAASFCKFIAIGSCAEFDVQKYRQNYLNQLVLVSIILDILHECTGHRPFVHLMRGLGILQAAIRFDSADSTNIARNHHRCRNQPNHVAALHARLMEQVRTHTQWVEVGQYPWSLAQIAEKLRAQQQDRGGECSAPAPLWRKIRLTESQRKRLDEYANSESDTEECVVRLGLAQSGEIALPMRWHSRIVHDSLDPGPLRRGSFRVAYGNPEQVAALKPLLARHGMLLLEQVHQLGELALLNRADFWRWANEVQRDCQQAIAVIPYWPENETDSWREASHAVRTPLSNYDHRTMFVWHFSDSDANLERAARLFNYLALRSDAAYDPRRWPKRCLKRLRVINGIINQVERKFRRRPFLLLNGPLGVLHEITRYDAADAPEGEHAWPADKLSLFLQLAQGELKNRHFGRRGRTTNFTV